MKSDITDKRTSVTDISFGMLQSMSTKLLMKNLENSFIRYFSIDKKFKRHFFSQTSTKHTKWQNFFSLCSQMLMESTPLNSNVMSRQPLI